MSDPVQSVIVTGVSTGIGHAIAVDLVERNYQVFGSVRRKDDGTRVVDELGENFRPLVFDVLDRDAINTSVNTVRSHLRGNRLVALVNNAGIAGFGPLECLDPEKFGQVVSVNVIGTFNVTNAFLPLLRSAGDAFAKPRSRPGKIINISSLSGILNTPMNGAYCIAKHAVESMGDVYRREILSMGIDVVAVRSGPVNSNIWVKNLDQQQDYKVPAYRVMSDTAASIMREAQANALPPRIVAELIADIIEGRKRRTAYHIGQGATVARLLSSSVFPRRLADFLIDRKLRPYR